MNYHERDWSSEVDGYPRQQERSEIMYSKITVEDIFAIQSLMMTRVRERARTTMVDETKKLHGVSLLDTQSDATIATAYDGSVERYMTCRVKKPRHDQWRMTIRFFEASNTEAYRHVGLEEHYYFDWLRNGNVAAWYTLGEKENFGDKTTNEIIDVRPITSTMCDELREQMWTHAKNHTLSRQRQHEQSLLDR